MPPALHFLVFTVAGWLNRHHDDLIDYLREENRVLREQLGGRPLRLTDSQRRRLAVSTSPSGGGDGAEAQLHTALTASKNEREI